MLLLLCLLRNFRLLWLFGSGDATNLCCVAHVGRFRQTEARPTPRLVALLVLVHVHLHAELQQVAFTRLKSKYISKQTNKLLLTLVNVPGTV